MKIKTKMEGGRRKMERMRPSSILPPRFPVIAALALLSFIALASDKFANTVVKDFSVPEYYEPPHETKMKSLLQGAEAEPQSGGQILIRKLLLQTFAEAGETQMVVHAPQCTFDSVQRSVRSDGHIEAQSGDGRFFIEGEGFLFQTTNWNLIMSNRVHTVIRSAPKKTAKQ
jgi:hypothetical protein